MTTLVIFVGPQGAQDFVEAAGIDRLYIESNRYEVQLTRFSTYPINPAMHGLIRFHVCTQILAISNPDKDKALNNIIYAVLSRVSVAATVEGISKHNCPGGAIIRLVSIEAAILGREILKRDMDMHKSLIEFDPNMCSKAYIGSA